jgi:hypothetical protein
MAYFTEYESNIKSGDLLIWSKYRGNFVGWAATSIIRLFTVSDYYHTGIAYRLKFGKLASIEATYPKVTLRLLQKRLPFYHIPMPIEEFTPDMREYLFDKLNENYSIWQAIQAYFGKPTKDNQWICTELCVDFYKQFLDLDLGDAYTPSKLVKNVLAKVPDTKMVRVVKD